MLEAERVNMLFKTGKIISMWDKKLCIIGFGCLLQVLNASSLENEFWDHLLKETLDKSSGDSDKENEKKMSPYGKNILRHLIEKRLHRKK